MSLGRARILNTSQITPAADALRQGDVVAIPTETVYGLAGNALNGDAVAKIFAVKERPSFDPLIVHISDHLRTLDDLALAGIVDKTLVTPGMRRSFDSLAKTFWPGPLTMILPKQSKISDLVTSGLDRVGVRMPAHPLAQKILKETGLPLAAPSANRFGRISPTTAQHVMDELGDRITYIVDGGPCDVGVESTVVALDDDKVWLLRPGKISLSDLKAVLSVPVEQTSSVHEKASPGMLASHYAPRKNMYLVKDLGNIPESLKTLSFDLLVTSGPAEAALKLLADQGLKPVATEILSKDSDAGEAAKSLFATMRSLDRSSGQVMIATHPSSDDGLWLAISDRLRRAAVRD
jgi:L-threonylcarbamoyladenylate synthase